MHGEDRVETQNTGRNMRVYILAVVIALVQVFDIVVHVATNQIEPIRIVSNMFIFVWLGIVGSGRLTHIAWRVVGGFVGVYLLLNGVFLSNQGLTNPDNNGEFRTVLFVLVGVTVVLSMWLTNVFANHTDKASRT
jgi:hypothetical protein